MSFYGLDESSFSKLRVRFLDLMDLDSLSGSI